MRAKIDGLLHLHAESAEDERVIEHLAEKMTFVNPNWQSAHDMGASTKGLERYSEYWVERRAHTSFPRALLPSSQWDSLSDSVVEGRTQHEATLSLPPCWEPREGQEEAVASTVDALGVYPWGGVLQAPCGSGKTVMGLEVIRRLGVPTAVLVHKEFLVRQWQERCEQFMPGARVGIVRLDRADTGNEYDLVICMIQSLLARDYGQELYDSFGLVVSDEVHRLGAPKWHETIGRFSGKYRLGLTATPYRKDGLAPVFYSHIGPICHEVPAQRLVPRLGIRRLDTTVERRAYHAAWMKKPNVGKLVTALAEDADRTVEIIRDILKANEAGRKGLVLTARVAHVHTLVGALAAKDVDASRFIGGMKEADQEKSLESDVVVATYPMAQEGLDCPEFDTLFLATPQGDVEQAVGRILRELPGKRDPLVVDYVDHKIGVCAGMFRARSRVYARLGVER